MPITTPGGAIILAAETLFQPAHDDHAAIREQIDFAVEELTLYRQYFHLLQDPGKPSPARVYPITKKDADKLKSYAQSSYTPGDPIPTDQHPYVIYWCMRMCVTASIPDYALVEASNRDPEQQVDWAHHE